MAKDPARGRDGKAQGRAASTCRKHNPGIGGSHPSSEPVKMTVAETVAMIETVMMTVVGTATAATTAVMVVTAAMIVTAMTAVMTGTVTVVTAVTRDTMDVVAALLSVTSGPGQQATNDPTLGREGLIILPMSWQTSEGM